VARRTRREYDHQPGFTGRRPEGWAGTPGFPTHDAEGAAGGVCDKNAADGRVALAKATDKQLLGPWTLLAGGQKVFTMPRIAVLRSFVMNHLIHHRAQLTVYLRLNNIPVPALYGPSADEGKF